MSEARLAALAKARQAKGGKRATGKEKMKAHSAALGLMRRRYPKIALPLIDQIENGSRTAAVKLKCLECSAWVRAEVRDCTVISCPLYPIRPYQKLTGSNPNDPGGRGVGKLERATQADPSTN